MPLQWDLAALSGTAYDADGFLTAQPDTFGAPGAQAYEAHHPLGFAARPRAPDEAGAPNVLTALEGNRGHAWLLGDPRATAALPPLELGGACMYGSPVPGRTRPTCSVIYGTTGTWQTLVPYEATSLSIALDVATAGAESIRLDHGAGMGLSITAGDTFSCVLRNRAGDAYLEVNDEGAVVLGNTKIVGAVVLGTATPSAAQSFAMATPLAVWMAAVKAACAGAGIVIPDPPAGLASMMAKGL